MQLSNEVKTVRIKPDGSGYVVAAGAADVNSDIVDIQGFHGVRFIIGFGAIVAGAATSVKAQQNTINSGTGMADLAGTAVTVADNDDNQIVVLDIYKPRERYLRLTTLRATQNSTIDFLLAEFYEPWKVPVTEDATIVVAAEKHVSPAEGTA